VTLALLGVAQAGTSWGPCPDVQLMSTFNPADYAGRWYQIQAGNLFQGSDQECVTATYTLESGNTLKVQNRASLTGGGTMGIDGEATCRYNSPICRVKFDWYIPAGPYLVVESDFTSYSIVYTCINYLFGLFRQDNVWILSRATSPTFSLGSMYTIIQERIPSYDLNQL